MTTAAAVSLDPAQLTAAVAWAQERYGACDVCAERCGVNRLTGQLGHCGLGEHAHVYKEYLHLGEERCLVPLHTIYLTGCNLRCVSGVRAKKQLLSSLAAGIEGSADEGTAKGAVG